MDLLPTTEMIDAPYKQHEIMVSATAQEARPITGKATLTNEVESGTVANQMYYFHPHLDITHEIRIEPLPNVHKEETSVSINDERLELLAEKYVARDWSREMEARLQIDHKKVEILHPRVTSEQIQAINDLREQLKESDEQLSKMLDDLGIR